MDEPYYSASDDSDPSNGASAPGCLRHWVLRLDTRGLATGIP
jgi:hypothetical protein